MRHRDEPLAAGLLAGQRAGQVLSLQLQDPGQIVVAGGTRTKGWIGGCHAVVAVGAGTKGWIGGCHAVGSASCHRGWHRSRWVGVHDPGRQRSAWQAARGTTLLASAGGHLAPCIWLAPGHLAPGTWHRAARCSGNVRDLWNPKRSELAAVDLPATASYLGRGAPRSRRARSASWRPVPCDASAHAFTGAKAPAPLPLASLAGEVGASARRVRGLPIVRAGRGRPSPRPLPRRTAGEGERSRPN